MRPRPRGEDVRVPPAPAGPASPTDDPDATRESAAVSPGAPTTAPDETRASGSSGRAALGLRVSESPLDRAADARVARPLRPGDAVAGFVVERLLGEGGMGVVAVARRPGAEPVALKVLHASVPPAERRRFDLEARSVARLDHPGVVKLIEFGLSDRGPFLAMELVDGLPLSVCQERAPLPLEDSLAVCEAIALAVGHAHRRGVVHRDLKPANVLIARDGRPRVVDFGLAKHLDAETALTETGTLVGTPSYMAPEQVRGPRDSVGAAADVHATGVILYELATGALPFDADDLMGLLRAIVRDEAEPPTRRAPDRRLPPDLDVLLGLALAKDPTRRYSNGEELARAIRCVRVGDPLP